MRNLKIKKGDTVEVIAGKDAGNLPLGWDARCFWHARSSIVRGWLA